MLMWDKKKSTIKSLLWSRFSHIDLKEGKKIIHSQELEDLFNAVIYQEDNIELQDFDKRIVQLRNKFK
jgi:hypothetical protein